MKQLAYKPLAILTSVLGGLMASRLFLLLWKAVSHDDHAPRADERGRAWPEILGAAALEGAVFGLVKAALDRASAKGFERATGSWPGD